MNTLEYQQLAAQTRYPFRDNSSLFWIQDPDSGTLPNDIILDAQVVCDAGYVGSVVLATIEYNDNDQWLFTFVGLDTFEVEVNLASETGINTYSARTADERKLLKLDIDVDKLRSYFATVSPATGTLTFDETNVLCVGCFRFLSPKVTEVTVYNTTGTSSAERVTALHITAGDLAFSEGANVAFTNINSYTESVAVSRAAGTGLYDGCPDLENYVYSVNNVLPNQYGNLILGNDACYSAIPGLDGMHIGNQCIAPCLAEDIINDSYYVNRVTDAIIQLTAYLNTIKNGTTGFTTMLNDYYTKENDRMASGNPYIIAQVSTQSNAVNHYHNIVLGVYNQGGQDANATVTMTTYGANLNVVPNTTYLTIGNNRALRQDVALTGAQTNVFQDVGLPCTSNNNFSLVLKQPVSNNDGLSAANDVLFTVHSNDGNYPGQTGGALVGLAPAKFSYNVVFRNSIKNNGRRLMNMHISFMDFLAPPSSNTYLTITYPSYFTMTDSKLYKGDVVQLLPAPGFNTVALDYRNNNTYYLTMECDGSHNTPDTFIIKAGNSHNSITRTILV